MTFVNSPNLMSREISESLQLSTDGTEGNLDDFMHPFAENSPTNHQAAARKRKSKRYRKKSVGTMIKIKHLKEVFDASADEEGILTREKFASAVTTLKLDLTNKESTRLFDKIIDDEDENEEVKFAMGINFQEFIQVLGRSIFFQSIISNYNVTHQKVPENYDYTAPTYINHRNQDYVVDNEQFGTSKTKMYDPSKHGKLYGEFKQFRAEIDYKWHTNYTEERQRWQDNVVKGIALRQAPQTHPWLVFTCGAMGSGKGYALRWMSSNNIFPLEEIVHIDPDHCKSLMPEWDNYVKKDSLNAGGHCHKESGFIQELCEKVSLVCRQNTWIDGSLGDHEWWSQWIKTCREKFPWYRIAIFYVYCEPEKVFKRALERGKTTGRNIPKETLLNSINMTEKSVKILGPMADFLAIINNNDSVPKLDRFEDRSHSFRAISLRFKQQFEGKEMKEFPSRLTRMKLLSINLENFKAKHVKNNIKSNDNANTNNISTKITEDDDIFNKMFDNKNLMGVFRYNTEHIIKNVPKMLQDTYLTLSAIHPVNLDPQSRKVAGIPFGKMSFAWCAGVSPKTGERLTTTDAKLGGDYDDGIELHNPLHRFLISGGFVYFENETHKIVAVNASFAGFAREKWLTGMENWLSIDFGKFRRLPKDKHLNWVDTTDVIIKKNGGLKVAWLLPNVLSHAPFGAFAFRIARDVLLEESGNFGRNSPLAQRSKTADDVKNNDKNDTNLSSPPVTLARHRTSSTGSGTSVFFYDEETEVDIYFPVIVSEW